MSGTRVNVIDPDDKKNKVGLLKGFFIFIAGEKDLKKIPKNKTKWKFCGGLFDNKNDNKNKLV